MSLSERDLFIWHKRPIYMAKEAYGNEHDRAYPKEAYRGLPKEAYGGLKEAYIFCLLQKRPMELSMTEHTPRVLPQNLHPRRQHNRMVVELQYCRRGFASVYMYRGFLM